MSNLYEIIAQIQKDLYCPVCGKTFEIGKIHLRGLFDHTLIIQTICSNGHITIFMTSFKNQSVKQKPIAINDVLDLQNTLKEFDGDFQKIWKN